MTTANQCVVAVDPGVSTGVAIRTRDNTFHALVIKSSIDLLSIVEQHKPDVLAFEDFNAVGFASKDGQATLRLVGAIELLCYTHNLRPVLQFPRERTPFLPLAKAMLQQRGLQRAPISHEIDATAHLLLYEDRVQRGVLDQIIKNRRAFT